MTGIKKKKRNRKRTEGIQHYKWVGIDFHDPQKTNIKTQTNRKVFKRSSVLCASHVGSQEISDYWGSFPHFGDNETEAKGLNTIPGDPKEVEPRKWELPA